MLRNISKTPRQEGESCRGVGRGQGLVEADAGDVGFFDGGRMVGLFFGEGEGEVLDAVCPTEFFEEHDEFAELFGEPVCIVGRSDSSEYHHVVEHSQSKSLRNVWRYRCSLRLP